MPALTTRQEARERLLKTALSAIDRLVPSDESIPLRGATFADFENQSYEAGDAFLTALPDHQGAGTRKIPQRIQGPLRLALLIKLDRDDYEYEGAKNCRFLRITEQKIGTGASQQEQEHRFPH